jgi:hypothetical protein
VGPGPDQQGAGPRHSAFDGAGREGEPALRAASPPTPPPPASPLLPDRKLLLVVRHGQAVSNYLSDTLGPDEWYGVEGTCDYTDKDKKHWDIFDAGGVGGGR